VRRQLGYAVGAAAAGAAVALFAASRVWREVPVSGPAPLGPAPPSTLTGGEIVPWLPAVGLVALAGAGALVATRGAVRVVVGGLLVACGLALVGAGGYAISDGARVWWPGVVAVGGLLAVDSGVLAIARARRWPALGARYERRPVATGSQSMWDAIDRGEDPTR
jgi:hypothetical protein